MNDEEDQCPNAAGDADNEGCPKIEEAVIKKVNYTAKNIQFAAGSNRLVTSSFKGLNDLAALMNNDASLLLSIEGHSDNTGDAARNKQLSEKRAEAVKEYLIKKGVAASRLTAEGFGSEKPIADNKTAAGRAINRRTELIISNH